MGEKRAYNARKPGGGRKKLKPEYDAGENLKEQMDAAVALYEEDCSLQSIADALALNPIYGMFYRFGLIDVPKEVKEKKNDRGNKKQKKGREDMLEENIKFFRRL